MNKADTVREVFGMLGDFERQTPYFADDFQVTDELGSPPMDKATWFGMGQMIVGSFPDMENVIDDIWEDGEDVMVTSHFAGTFMNDLDLSMVGMGVIPASGAQVEFPRGNIRITFNGGKISRLHNTDTGPDAGLGGFVRALSV